MNVSIIEKEAVLAVAREKKIAGIMSFACDPGVVTAAYVAEKMGLPFQCSYEAATILQDKGLFREFLRTHGFNCPHAKSYMNATDPLADVEFFTWPVIVKPVDSAGSKGVTKVETPEDFDAAIQKALTHSKCGRFLVEDFLTFESHHSSTDPFTVGGQLHAVSYSDQLFDREADNPYTPAFIVWPSTMKQEHQDYLTRELQRLMDLLHVGDGIYNVETVVGSGGIPYIMEVSPRGGGCKIAELQEMAFSSTLIENEIRKAVGMPLLPIETRPIEGCWCEMVIHARPGQEGTFEKVDIRNDILQHYVRTIDLAVRRGDRVHPFTGANMSLGDLFLQVPDRATLDAHITNVTSWLKVVVS